MHDWSVHKWSPTIHALRLAVRIIVNHALLRNGKAKNEKQEENALLHLGTSCAAKPHS